LSPLSLHDALPICGHPAQRQLRDGDARLALEVDAPVHAAGHARKLGAQAGKLGERDSKVDVGSAVSQPVHFERPRPGRRHGARIIGSDSSQVKIRLGAKPLFPVILPPLILASTSPYRRELLARLPLAFEALPPRVPEERIDGESPADHALRLALAKAQAVAGAHPGALVIGADQVAAAGERLLGKPGDAVRCRAQLACLSGRSARFYTACAVLGVGAGVRLAHVDTTTVVFRSLTAQEIERYVASEQPYDCAGGFKAEASGIALPDCIERQQPTALIRPPPIWLAGALRGPGVLRVYADLMSAAPAQRDLRQRRRPAEELHRTELADRGFAGSGRAHGALAADPRIGAQRNVDALGTEFPLAAHEGEVAL